MTGFNFMMATFMVLAGVVAFVLLIVFVMVPIFRGVGAFVTACFNGTAWFCAHVFEYIGGTIGDTVRSFGAILAMLALAPLALLNVIIGRWSAAAHFADSVKREFYVTGACLYRVLLRRPLKLFWLHGLLEGLEERVPEAVYATPGTDKPRNPTNQFSGYTIVGSLAGGGSGGKLYIARPDDAKRMKLVGHPEHVVIKAFALTEGSSLPQIVRESRALECAKQLGHVLDHGMDEHRFHYVMPYHPGDHLGIITRQLHGESEGALSREQLTSVMSYISDLLATLSLYHEGGLWHKDVKPENIIVHDGRAHLVDLGLVTPLKSAMTLTTHGTEYFRDPEMVRQALRGVKVHQVDGAKFDIYAVGAVLYFMIENTFPAHGGLSRFTKKSPEALRWIIRRAMAEYNQRYNSAATVLADVEAVAGSTDPFTFKPADLPSMSGGHAADIDADIHTESPHAAQVSAAGSPAPEREQVWGFGVGVGSGGPYFGAGSIGSNQSRSERPSRRRPLLRITNWWTGAYAVDDGNGSQIEPKSRTTAPRPTPREGRLSAPEQLKRARSRARKRQNHVVSRRHKVGLERQPSAMLGFLVVGFLIISAMIIVPLVTTSSNRPAANTTEAAVAVAVERDSGLPLLLMLESEDPLALDDPYIQRVIDTYENNGYHVLSGIDAEDRLRDMFTQWQDDETGTANERFEDVLAEHDLYGFLHIKVTNAAAGDPPRVSETLIRSSRSEALQRRRSDSGASSLVAIPDEPLLLINDHPARADARVQRRVNEIIEVHTFRGWEIITDDDAEVAVRKALPTVVGSETIASERLSRILHEHGYGGVLYLGAAIGDGATDGDRVRTVVLRAQPVDESGTIGR